MTHYKTLLDPAKFLGAVDFPKEREVTISRVVREKLPKRDGDADQSAPMLYILDKEGKEHHRPLKMPKTVLHGFSLMFGVEYEAWVGKKIAIFATRCLAFGEVEECLRARFPPEIDSKVRQWLKKRKASPSAYMLQDRT
jgi:hypothetical protein